MLKSKKLYLYFFYSSDGEKLMVYLQITMTIPLDNRPAAAEIYQKYKLPFLNTVDGAVSKELLIREKDVQVLHGFETLSNAESYLQSELFNNDVVCELKPLFVADPDIRIYQSV